MTPHASVQAKISAAPAGRDDWEISDRVHSVFGDHYFLVHEHDPDLIVMAAV
jgi:hypothetical protein